MRHPFCHSLFFNSGWKKVKGQIQISEKKKNECVYYWGSRYPVGVNSSHCSVLPLDYQFYKNRDYDFLYPINILNNVLYMYTSFYIIYFS